MIKIPANDITGAPRFSGVLLNGNEADGKALSFTADIPSTGHYRLIVNCHALDGKRFTSRLDIDGVRAGNVEGDGKGDSVRVGRLYIEKGSHTFTISQYFGLLLIESVAIEEDDPLDRSIFDVDPEPINKNASPNARILYNYLRENYGKKVLTGQTTSGTMDEWGQKELEAIHQATGKLPAIIAVDLIDACATRKHVYGTDSRDVQRGIDYFNYGGLVTIAWHWNAPMHQKLTKEHMWWSGFYTEASTFSLKDALADKESPEFKAIVADIEDACEVLRPYKEQDIPVLWRPLHEAAGGWFWWGACGPEPCIELWNLMYDIMVNKHGMNNLLWVWNGQHPDWYPGDDKVDIIGADIYAGKHVYHPQNSWFQICADYPSKTRKIVAFTENGTIPDIDQMVRDGSMWSWYCTWCGHYAYTTDDSGKVVYNEEYTEKDVIVKMYNHPDVITLDKLDIKWNGK